MSALEKLKERIVFIKQPHIILGVDPYINKIPPCYTRKHQNFINAIDEWVRDLLFLCKDEVVGVKFQIAFFEFLGSEGIKLCFNLAKHAKEAYNYFVILDVKRNDIPDISSIYAQTYLDNDYIDAITTTPYFGLDSMESFIKSARIYKKLIFVVLYSSNRGAIDFQRVKVGDRELWEEVLSKIYDSYKNEVYLGFVVGATNPVVVRKVQETFKESWILSPGFGPQGADISSWKRVYLKPITKILFTLSRALTVPDPIEYYTDRKIYAGFVKKSITEWKSILMPLYKVG